MKSIRNALLAAAVLAAFPAMAQYSAPQGAHWYLGGGVGRGNLNMSGTDLTNLDAATLDDTTTTYTVRLGFRFNRHWAVEAGYYDLGEYEFAGRVRGTMLAVAGDVRVYSYGISLVGILPIDQFDLYGRIGYVHSKFEGTAGGVSAFATEKETQDEAHYGVGARWNIGPAWGIFGEWMKNDKTKVDGYLIGVDFRF
jgi:OOP family OmpA-OmpF porin